MPIRTLAAPMALTAACLGGPGRSELLITTSAAVPAGGAPAGAGGGALYRLEVDTPGLCEHAFVPGPDMVRSP